ncbi:hypothetical protein LTR64_008684 [Lithohypha guttulata]|uniref:Uncharacterized protein n=1 Tax=Lithohypha guttulata TaxID=1690604 RepID=A0AAN7SYX0_9EURO|nr:hypothetical protein LTR51_008710 [Lithohypha guttulata]KAK5085212.1 hypothetical protein LTR05_004492 [Lithohypha guttulata]
MGSGDGTAKPTPIKPTTIRVRTRLRPTKPVAKNKPEAEAGQHATPEVVQKARQDWQQRGTVSRRVARSKFNAKRLKQEEDDIARWHEFFEADPDDDGNLKNDEPHPSDSHPPKNPLHIPEIKRIPKAEEQDLEFFNELPEDKSPKSQTKDDIEFMDLLNEQCKIVAGEGDWRKPIALPKRPRKVNAKDFFDPADDFMAYMRAIRRNGICLDPDHAMAVRKATKAILAQSNWEKTAATVTNVLFAAAGIALIVVSKGSALGLLAVPYVIPTIVVPAVKVAKGLVNVAISARNRYKKDDLKRHMQDLATIEASVGVRVKSEQDKLEYQKFRAIAAERMGEMEKAWHEKFTDPINKVVDSVEKALSPVTKLKKLVEEKDKHKIIEKGGMAAEGISLIRDMKDLIVSAIDIGT